VLTPVGPAVGNNVLFSDSAYHDIVSLPLPAGAGSWVSFTGWVDIFNGNFSGGIWPAATISCVLVDSSGYLTQYDESRVGTAQSSTVQTTMTVPIALTAWYAGGATAKVACHLISSSGLGRVSGRLRGVSSS
jgi:hypothetical protein